MNAGDTFSLQDKSVDPHLWVIISDPSRDASQVVVVNLTTAHPSKEDFCLIHPGEHPFVTHATCVAYNYARVTTLEKLVSRRDDGHIVPRDPVSADLLKRIREGVPLSNLMPMKCVAIIAKQRLF